VNKRVLCTAM